MLTSYQVRIVILQRRFKFDNVIFRTSKTAPDLQGCVHVVMGNGKIDINRRLSADTHMSLVARVYLEHEDTSFNKAAEKLAAIVTSPRGKEKAPSD